MIRDLVTVSEDASLSEIADCLESAGVKRVLVMRVEKLVGLVSHSNLVRALAAMPEGAARLRPAMMMKSGRG